MGAKQTIVAKAMKDAAFRKRLMQDPRAALESELGVELPAGLKVQIHEDSPGVINLVLPGPVEVSSQRPLTDEQLQQVSGGMASTRVKVGAGDTFGGYTACCSGGSKRAI